MTTVKSQDWYKKAGMAGYTWAKENYDVLFSLKSLAKTKRAKQVLKNSVDFSCVNWHYWSNWSRKDISLLKHAIKSFNKGESACSVYYWVDSRHAMWKSDLLRSLELMAYVENQDKYRLDYYKGMKIYGMTRADAFERCDKYMGSLIEKYGYEVK